MKCTFKICNQRRGAEPSSASLVSGIESISFSLELADREKMVVMIMVINKIAMGACVVLLVNVKMIAIAEYQSTFHQLITFTVDD